MRKYFSLLCIWVAVIALFIGCLYFYQVSRLNIPQVAFDKDVWAAWTNDVNQPTARQMMIADLVENMLPGLSREEIEALRMEGVTVTLGCQHRRTGLCKKVFYGVTL